MGGGGGSGGIRTDETPSGAVGHGVQQAHEPAGVADGLAVPQDGLLVTAAGVLGDAGILGEARGLVGGGDREHEEEG